MSRAGEIGCPQRRSPPASRAALSWRAGGPLKSAGRRSRAAAKTMCRNAPCHRPGAPWTAGGGGGGGQTGGRAHRCPDRPAGRCPDRPAGRCPDRPAPETTSTFDIQWDPGSGRENGTHFILLRYFNCLPNTCQKNRSIGNSYNVAKPFRQIYFQFHFDQNAYY